MAWLSRNTFSTTDKLHADDLNNLANDQRAWGGNVNGGGYILSNVILATSVLRAAVTVTSVFGRNGDVVAMPLDYTPAFIGAVPVARHVIAGSGMTGGGALSADVTLSASVTSVFSRVGDVVLTPADITGATGVLTSRQILTPAGSGLTANSSTGANLGADITLRITPDSINQRVQVYVGGTVIGVQPRHAINFVNGANVVISATEDTTNNWVNVQVASTTPPGMTDPTQFLGDLIVRGTSSTTRLAVGTANGQVLTVDSNSPQGVKWAVPAPSNAVASVFGRTGTVVAASGDYNVTQVTNAVDATGSYPNPPWIVNIPWTKITNPPNFMVDGLTTKGDIPVHTTTATTRFPVGSDGLVLTADSSQGFGVRWGALPAAITQSPWTGNIDAANFALSHVKALGLGGPAVNASATYPLVVQVTSSNVGAAAFSTQVTDLNTFLLTGCSATYNTLGGVGGIPGAPWMQAYDKSNRVTSFVLQPGGSYLGVGQLQPGFTVDVLGDVNCSGVFRQNGIAIPEASQTPWTQDIEAASFKLNNTGGLAIGAPVGTTAMLRIQTPNPSIVMQGPVASSVESIQFLAGASSDYRWEMGVGHPLEGHFYIRDMNSAPIRIQIDSAGNVGLNQPPFYPLDVMGDINCTGVYRINGVSIGGVFSVFSRTGNVLAQSGDYTASQITNAVDITQSYANPTWIASLAWSKIIGAPATGVSTVFGRAGAVTAATNDYNVTQVTNAVGTSRQILTPVGSGLTVNSGTGANLATDITLSVIPNATNQKVQVLAAGIVIGTRKAINFVNTASATISVSDDQTNDKVDISIVAGGGSGGGGMTDPTTDIGDLIVRGAVFPAAPTRLAVGLPGQVLQADNLSPSGMKWASVAGAASQSPWLGDIDAAGHNLTNGAQFTLTTLVAGTAVKISDPSSAVAWHMALLNNGGTFAVQRDSDSSNLLLLNGVSMKVEVPVPLAVNKSTAPAFPLDVSGDCNVTGVYRVNGVALNLSGLVTSVFGRNGDVVASNGDYTAAQVTNAVSMIGSYPNPAWITSLAYAKITGVPNFLVDPLTTKGDLVVHTTTTSRLPLGGDGQVLTADSTQAAGVKWAPSIGGVTSVFTRTGAVAAVAGDYLAAQVTNAVDTTQTYANPAWITALAWAKITGAPTFVNSIFTRTGAVVAVSGDYTAAQITNAVSTISTYADPAWITSLAWSKISGTPAFPGDPTTSVGDMIVRGATAPATRLGVGTDTYVLTADSTQPLGVKWAPVTSGSQQTPWTSNINGGNFQLTNVASIGIGIATAPVYPLDLATTGTNTARFSSSNAGGLTYIRMENTGGTGGGTDLAWVSQNSAGTATSAVEMVKWQNGEFQFWHYDTAGYFTFYTGGSARLKITAAGQVGISVSSPAANLTAGGAGYTSSNPPTSGPVCRSVVRMQSTGTTPGTLDFGFIDSTGMAWINSVMSGNQAITFKLSLNYGGGLVGVGSVIPAYALDVAGDINFSGSLRKGGVVQALGQTPWAQGINGGGFALSNVSLINTLGINSGGGLNPSNHQVAIFSGTADDANLSATCGGTAFGSSNQNPQIIIGAMTSTTNVTQPMYIQTKNQNNTGQTFPLFINPLGGGVFINCGNAGGGSSYALDVTGDINFSGNLRKGGVIQNPSQTPWTSAIDGGGFALSNVATVALTGGALSSSDVNVVNALGNVQNNSFLNIKVTNSNAAGSARFIAQGQGAPSVQLCSAGTGAFPPYAGLAYLQWDSPTSFTTFCSGTKLGEISSTGLRKVYGSPSTATLTADCGILNVGCTGNDPMICLGVTPAVGDSYIQVKGKSNSSSYALLLQPKGNVVSIGLASAGAQLFQLGLDQAGKPSTNTWTIVSDVRLKQNVKWLEGGLDIIKQIRPVEAEYNGLHLTRAGDRVVSVVVEELRKILPGCVPSHRGKLREEDTEEQEILDFNSHEILFHLILAVQQLAAMVGKLEGSPAPAA